MPQVVLQKLVSVNPNIERLLVDPKEQRKQSYILYDLHLHTRRAETKVANMDQAKELLEMPREFMKDGRQFLTRCSKRAHSTIWLPERDIRLIEVNSGQARVPAHQPGGRDGLPHYGCHRIHCEAEYASPPQLMTSLLQGQETDIGRAVHIPVNNILVGGA